MSFSLPGKAASLLALSAQLAGQAWVPPSNGLAPPPPSDFVSVNGTDGFLLNGSRFVVSGANQYNLMTSTAFGHTEEMVAVLDQAVRDGLNVLRTWAFNDGERAGALQPHPGVIEEETAVALDTVVAAAKERGLRLILVLVNGWDDYGGIATYAQWAGVSPKEEFFASPDCFQMYFNFVGALLNRTNTLTGLTYRDESAIMAFELINEPRIPQDDGSGDTFQTWVEVAAGAFKSLDSNHLLGIGSEGFFGASTPELLGSNPYSRASAGTDFSRNAAAPGIDFAVAHAYPDQWMPSSSFDTQVNFVGAWYRAHVLEAQRINKNFLLEEFGCDRANDLDNRNTFFATVYDTSFQLLREGYGACAGELFWLLSGSDSAPDYDGYSVRPDDASTIALIQSQAARMKSVVAPPPPEAATPAAAGPAQAAAPLASL